jgi:peptidoglycan/xylan/chitin deacetylase (PgdA/CDA1 family)
MSYRVFYDFVVAKIHRFIFYLSKTPGIIQSLFPEMDWKGVNNTTTKTIYLTFDDGPTPGVTTWVLDALKEYEALATFFCVGQNVSAHPGIYQQILEEGHTVGNHTHSHVSGFKTSTREYIQEVKKAQEVIDSSFFRPPYGRIRRSQSKLLKEGYRIVMWDVLSGDFDPSISAEKCISNVVNNVEDGSIVVFHDSKKAFPVLQKSLLKVLKKLQNEGYHFSAINNDTFSE